MLVDFIKKIRKGLIIKKSGYLAGKNYPELRAIPFLPGTDVDHLVQTIEWLERAQDVTHTGGVSAYYDVAKKKWGPAYRETTGYIIQTFIEYFHATGNSEYLERAKRMGDWELSVQCDDGAFGELKPDGSVGKKVFNTGQVILGLVALYLETKKLAYLASAEKAAMWLLSIQEADGRWEKYTTQGARTYHSRVAWALSMLHSVTGNTVYAHAAQNNIDWVVHQQKENFWFDNTSLSKKNEPWTHLIAYAISGLLEYYFLSEKKDKRIFDSFYGASKALLLFHTENRIDFLPATFDKDWKAADSYSCLTGNAQLAIVWMQLYDFTKEDEFLKGAEDLLEQIKRTQMLDMRHDEVRGGVFGSYPIDGDYAPFLLINWAAKFFADALLLKKKVKHA